MRSTNIQDAPTSFGGRFTSRGEQTGSTPGETLAESGRGCRCLSPAPADLSVVCLLFLVHAYY